MYFGSVRFFKHLILTIVALLILIPTLIALVFFTKSNKLTAELGNVKAQAQVSNNDSGLTEINRTPTENLNTQEKDILPTSSKTEKEGEVFPEPLPYQLMFPEMMTEHIRLERGAEKIVYLTFDDGPSKRTPEVLDILDSFDIKATFFVIYKDDDFSNSMYREIVNRGHTIAVHSASHDYKAIYDSVEAYLTDFEKMYSHIKEITGVTPTLFRFPGGSVNSYNSGIYMEIISEMTRRGFVYHDWNVSAQDASEKATENSIYHMVTDGAAKRDKSVVLMHDSIDKTDTVAALPKIIEDLQKQGYGFAKLDASVAPFLFSYNKP